LPRTNCSRSEAADPRHVGCIAVGQLVRGVFPDILQLKKVTEVEDLWLAGVGSEIFLYVFDSVVEDCHSVTGRLFF